LELSTVKQLLEKIRYFFHIVRDLDYVNEFLLELNTVKQLLEKIRYFFHIVRDLDCVNEFLQALFSRILDNKRRN
jgi:hypothetical protein